MYERRYECRHELAMSISMRAGVNRCMSIDMNIYECVS